MTIVANSGADAYLKRLPKGLRLLLVHGHDEGLIHERAKAAVAAALEGDKDPLRLTRLQGDAVAREPGALMDEAQAISMFGGHRAIWIEAEGRDLLAALSPLLGRPPQDCTIVVEAGALKKGTALRVAFERAEFAASIECYADDRRSLEPLIDAEARAAGLKIAPEARAALIALLGEDRMTTRGEIAKLTLYAMGKETIGVEDVEAIVADAAPSSLGALVDAALIGPVSALESAGGRFFGEGGDANLLMIMLVARVMLLHRLRLEMERGSGFDAAAQGLFVRLPPSAKAALERQAAAWTSAALSKRLPAVQAAAARVRREPKLAQMSALRALWALASGARAGARA